MSKLLEIKKNNEEEGEIKNKIMKEFESVYFINLSILFIGIEKYQNKCNI